MRTVPLLPIGGLDELEVLLATTERPVTLVFDADNTLVRQRAAVAEFQRTVEHVVRRFEENASVTRVLVVTNGPDRGVASMIHRGNKPWTSRRRLGIAADEEIWVVGDQTLTDGVLAWRLGGTFVHLAIETQREAVRQTLMRRAGKFVERHLFRR